MTDCRFLTDAAKTGAVRDGYLIDSTRYGVFSGGRYFVDKETLSIIRTDQSDFIPSSQWTARAVYRYKNGHLKWFASFPDAVALLTVRKDFLTKRYTPRYFLGDMDHGTPRVQGDGIRKLSMIKFHRNMKTGFWQIAH
jgi:hypothetical protein